jgi:hypothetical protein
VRSCSLHHGSLKQRRTVHTTMEVPVEERLYSIGSYVLYSTNTPSHKEPSKPHVRLLSCTFTGHFILNITSTCLELRATLHGSSISASIFKQNSRPLYRRIPPSIAISCRPYTDVVDPSGRNSFFCALTRVTLAETSSEYMQWHGNSGRYLKAMKVSRTENSS